MEHSPKCMFEKPLRKLAVVELIKVDVPMV